MSIQIIPATEPQALEVTAFGETLVGELHPQFQGSFEYTVSNTDLNANTVTAGGTVTQASAMAVVGTSTTTASDALFQSVQHAKYRAGIGGNSRFTALFTSPVAGTEQYIGVMDEAGSSETFENGYGIGYTGTTFGVHRWVGDTLTTVALANCDDPLDGTGPSGMTIDQTKLNVYQIRFQYLGGGPIEYCIEDDSTGRYVVFHRVLYANLNTSPSTNSPNFHFTIWADNKGTTSDIVVKSGSYAYFVEGKTSFIEIHQPQNSSGLQETTGIVAERAIFTMRNRALYASKSNFIDVVLENISVSIEANAANNLGSIRVVKNTTLGGTPSYSDINTNNSVIEIDTAGTTLTGGKELLSLSLAGKNDAESLPLEGLRIFLHSGDAITLAGTSANSATIDGSILWRELF